MGRPRSHDADTAAALLAAAERIAEAEGFAALTVRRVAEEVGTTTRAVYSLFGSKDGLVVALATRGFGLLAADVAALPVTTDPAEDAVQAGARCFRDFVLAHPALYRAAFQREAVADSFLDEHDAARRRALAVLTERLARVVEGGGLGDAALAFHALCEGLAALELRGALGADGAPRWAGSLRALVRGLA